MASFFNRLFAPSSKDAILSVAPAAFHTTAQTLSLQDTPMANVTQIRWTDPTLRTDGTTIAAGEITGHTVGVRQVSGTAGTYPFSASAPAGTTTELLNLLAPALPTGVPLVAAVQVTTAQGVSIWAAESLPFTLLALPNAPTNVIVS
jgi:hypothetical protein